MQTYPLGISQIDCKCAQVLGSSPSWQPDSNLVVSKKLVCATATMALCEELLLELNTDCLEFCQLQDSTWKLAVGTYQLDEATGTRHGRLHMFSMQRGPWLHLDSTLDVPGIFDLHWWHPGTSPELPQVSLALADGTLQLVTPSADVAATASSSSSHSHALTTSTSCQAISEGMALYVDWGNTNSPPNSSTSSSTTAALSGSSGHLSMVAGVEGGLQQLQEWKAHDLEAWVVSFDQHQPGLIYSGSDDSSWKAWDLRSSCSAAEQSPAWVNRRTHSAGVTSISSHPRQQHVVVTGSYDEYARVWDMRMAARPVSTAEVRTGGGVWRLKWHPRDDTLLLAACMYQGCALLRASPCWDSIQLCLPGHLRHLADDACVAVKPAGFSIMANASALQVVEEYGGHESIAYGADWFPGSLEQLRAILPEAGSSQDLKINQTEPHTGHQAAGGQSADGQRQQQQEEQQQQHRWLAATCSFYDRRLHLWSPTTICGAVLSTAVGGRG